MSKELEALECIVVDLTPIAKEHNKEEIEQLKKSLEVLEIIKEKGVNVGLLSRCANAERYNKGMCYESRYLTQEEYDILKEVLL